MDEMNADGSYHASNNNCQDWVEKVHSQYSSPQLNFIQDRLNTRGAFDRATGGSRLGNLLLSKTAALTHTSS